MALSMRRQATRHKKGKEQAERRRYLKQVAVSMLKDKKQRHSIQTISAHTSLSKSLIYNLKQLVDTKNEVALQRHLSDTTQSRTGGKTILTPAEEKMIVRRMLEAAERGFAVDNDTLKQVMAHIAGDNRSGWKNGIPSKDAIRSFRARHRELSYKTFYPKDNAKLKGENYEHIKTFFDVVAKLGDTNKGLLTDPSRIWNMDETSVDSTWGKAVKSFGSASSKHGGCRVAQKTQGVDKHITAVVVCSASGLKAPPFFIIAGKNVMSNWFEPLPDVYSQSEDICKPFQRPNWMPKDAVVKCTENGSMTKEILAAFVKHVNHFVRKHVPESQSYLLTMDGHSSRKGFEWVVECESNNCIPVIKPANTSHILQPCERRINKTFQESIRFIRDSFNKSAIPETRTPKFNFACAVYAHHTITVPAIQSSFESTGLFPFQPEYPEQFREKKEAITTLSLPKEDTVAERLQSLKLRSTDAEVLAKARSIFESSMDGCDKVRHLSELLRNAVTAHNIIMNHITPLKTEKELAGAGFVKPKSVVFNCGAPAEHKTVAKMLEEYQQKKAQKREKERQASLQAKRGEAERLEKEASKAKAQEQRAREQQRREEYRRRKNIALYRGRVAKDCMRHARRSRRKYMMRSSKSFCPTVLCAAQTVSQLLGEVVGDAVGPASFPKPTLFGVFEGGEIQEKDGSLGGAVVGVTVWGSASAWKRGRQIDCRGQWMVKVAKIRDRQNVLKNCPI